MLMEAFIPIFSILGLGMGIQYFISARFDFKLSRGDFYLAAVLIGEFVLIFSMGIVGILTKNGLWLIPRLYLVISTTLSTAAIYHYVTHNLHRLESFRSPFPEEWTGEHVLALLVGLFLLEYIFLILIFPLRGFDALERYLPDAFYFYQQDSIPKINALTATPTFKSPAHTLLFTYVLYVSRKEEYYLIPFLTLFSLVVVAYKFGEVFLGSPRRGWLAALLLLALPLTKELVTNWAYYQDLYIAFYFAAGIYFFLLAFHHQRTGYSIVSGLAVGLAILAKMSGWALPVIILLLAPAGRKGRVLKVVILIPMASWLAMKAATKTFVGVSFAIALIAFLLILLIYLAPLENASVTRTTTPIIIGILAGGWWIWRTAIMLPGSFDTLAEFYFQIKGSPQWEYPVHASQGSILALEQLHSVSFLGTCLILFVSFWFATGWAIPKMMTFLSPRKTSVFSIWCLGFLMIWFAYYFTNSVRYLSVIIIPLVLLTVAGIIILYERFLKGRIPLLGLETTVLAFSAFQFRHKILWHSWRGFTDRTAYANYPLEAVLIFSGAFLAILAFFIIVYDSEGHSSGQSRLETPRYERTLLLSLSIAFFVLIAAAAPVEKEIGELQSVGWDTQRFAEQNVYEYRPAFQELVATIIEEDLPDASIIGANVFGLEFFVQQPVIDLFWGGKSLVSSFFQGENVSEGINLLEDYETRLIVSLNEESPFYERFQAEIVAQTYIFDVVRNNLYFRNVLCNQEFALYRLLSYSSFQGFVDLSFVTSEEKTNILEKTGNFLLKSNPSLIATIDLTNLKWTWAKCTIELNYATDSANHTANRVLKFPFTNRFIKINTFRLPLENCSLGTLKLVFDLYDSNEIHKGRQIFQARPKNEDFLINYDQERNFWFTASNLGYEIV